MNKSSILYQPPLVYYEIPICYSFLLRLPITNVLLGGACTSAVIALVFHAADWGMPAATAMCIGIAQTIIIIVVSTSRILATL